MFTHNNTYDITQTIICVGAVFSINQMIDDVEFIIPKYQDLLSERMVTQLRRDNRFSILKYKLPNWK